MAVTSNPVRSAAIVASALITVVALAACSSNGGSTQGPIKSNTDAATLSMGYPGDPAARGYDPAKYTGTGQLQFLDGFYQALFVRNPTGSPQPGLATAESFNKDATVLTLKLKEGVSFSDGSVLDASLVKANLDRQSDTSNVAFTTEFPGNPDAFTVAVIDPHTVALHFKTPHSGFDVDLAGTTGMIVGKSAHRI